MKHYKNTLHEGAEGLRNLISIVENTSNDIDTILTTLDNTIHQLKYSMDVIKQDSTDAEYGMMPQLNKSLELLEGSRSALSRAMAVRDRLAGDL